jgi:hypothetical protein
MRTEKAIKDEIEVLMKIKPRIRQFTAFRDDNHAAIEAQIDVLNDRLDEEEIEKLWPTDEQEHLNQSAVEAYRWMTGERDEGLADEWEPLAKISDD